MSALLIGRRVRVFRISSFESSKLSFLELVILLGKNTGMP